MQEFAKIIIISGIVLIVLGAILFFFNKIPFLGKLPGDINITGKLPGDIYIQKKNFTFYFPLATSLLVSAILSLLF